MMSRNAGTAAGGRNHPPLLLCPGKNHSGHLLYAFHDPVSLHFKGILWILLNKGGWTKKAQVLSTWISLRRTSINFLSRSYHGVWAQGKRRGLSLSPSLRATLICPLDGISLIFLLNGRWDNQRQLVEVDLFIWFWECRSPGQNWEKHGTNWVAGKIEDN